MILDFIFEHIPIFNILAHVVFLEQILVLTVETITQIHINVNFQTFTHLRSETRFLNSFYFIYFYHGP